MRLTIKIERESMMYQILLILLNQVLESIH